MPFPLFQNDLVSSILNRLCYFTQYQDLELDPKPTEVKWESFDFNGICARPMSLCKSDFSPIHTRNLFQWTLNFSLPSTDYNLEIGGKKKKKKKRNFRPDWNQILIESSCDTEIILKKCHYQSKRYRTVIISPHW